MNDVERQPLEPPSESQSYISGKLVIIGVLAIALTSAVASWCFRYNATHRAAQFWGRDAAALIRDAPHVSLVEKPRRSDKRIIDVSHAHGLLHLRTALLEDNSFVWTKTDQPKLDPIEGLSHWWLCFSDTTSQKILCVSFSEDCREAAQLVPDTDGMKEGAPISTEPIAAGLREMFDEFTKNRPSESADSPR